MKKVMMSVGLILGLLALGALSLQVAVAQENEYGPLLKVLPNSKQQLADGIHQATKATEVPISAKFELDDNGKLSLSVYTAEKGLASDAENNVLKELSGSPESGQWSPEAEVFKEAFDGKVKRGFQGELRVAGATQWLQFNRDCR